MSGTDAQALNEAAVLAALLGESRDRLLRIREELLEARRELLIKDQIILNLEAELMRSESEAIMRNYGLEDGDTVERDPETGEYFLRKASDSSVE